MFANIICFPPLGQSSIATAASDGSKQSVKFTVLIECDVSSVNKPWEVVLWHNSFGCDQWKSYPLRRSQSATTIDISPSSSRVARLHFHSTLQGKPIPGRSLRFTIKFRNQPDQNWKWAQESLDLPDGEVIFPTVNIQSSIKLQDYIAIDKHFTAHTRTSSSSDAQVWEVQGKVQAAKGRKSCFEVHDFGTPKSFSRWVALVRLWKRASPWIAPRHGKSGGFSLDREAIFCSFLMSNGSHLALLPISGANDTQATFLNGPDNQLKLSVRNDSESIGTTRVVVAVSSNFESAMAAAMHQARLLVSPQESHELSPSHKSEVPNSRPVSPIFNEFFDGLTYCTWNGLGQNLTDKKIFGAMESLKKNNIHVTNLIIDDNWQSLNNEGQPQYMRGWVEFEANKKGFPLGLKDTVKQIRSTQPSIQHVAVWHAFGGYWGGIAPEGKLAKEYNTVDLVTRSQPNEPDSRTMIAASDIHRFYDDFYSFLSSCGIDSVKTDVQFHIDEVHDADARRALTKNYQDAWAASSSKWFSMRVISCMSQVPQIIFYSLLNANRPRYLFRNSNDFYPNVPDSHAWHLFCNAHNALLSQNLNVLPDWDMFQTDHPFARFHAAARCVSGGPIYFTDEPGKHDVELIRQMTASTTSGATTILRPSNVGRSLQHYTAYNEERLLKIGTLHESKGTESGIIGIFNVSHRHLTELVPLSEIPGIRRGQGYLVRAFSSGVMTEISAEEGENALISVSLEERGWEILTALPLHTFGSLTRVAILGLLGKMTGVAAITSFSITSEENDGAQRPSTSIVITTKALGVLGLFIGELSEINVEDDLLLLLSDYSVPPSFVDVNHKASILKIDIEKAWAALGLPTGGDFLATVRLVVYDRKKSKVVCKAV